VIFEECGTAATGWPPEMKKRTNEGLKHENLGNNVAAFICKFKSIKTLRQKHWI